MGLREWRTKRAMADPVRGEFRVSDSYYPHPGSTPMKSMLTGVVVADGVPPTPAEQLDQHSAGIGHAVLPALVDRADPTNFLILWDEVPALDYRQQARDRAEADARRMQPGVAPDESTPTPGAVTVSSLDELPSWMRTAVAHALDDEPAGPVTVTYGADPSASSPRAARPTGRPAQAVLVAVTDVPVPAYALPSPTASLCDLTVDIPRPDGSTYRTVTRMGFRSAQRRAQLAVLGSAVPVTVDPADETIVEIDIAAWDAGTR